MNAVRILDEPKQEQPLPRRHVADAKRDRFRKRYGLMLIGVFALAAYTMFTCCLTGTIVHHNTKKHVRAEMEQYYAAQLEAYKAEIALTKREKAKELVSKGIDAAKDAARAVPIPKVPGKER